MNSSIMDKDTSGSKPQVISDEELAKLLQAPVSVPMARQLLAVFNGLIARPGLEGSLKLCKLAVFLLESLGHMDGESGSNNKYAKWHHRERRELIEAFKETVDILERTIGNGLI